jgi:multiple sugar transport system permease protein
MLSRSQRLLLGVAGRYLILLVASVLFIVPYLLALLSSLKPLSQMFSGSPFALPHPLTWQNFLDLFNKYDFGHFLVNTAVVAFSIAIGQVLFCALAAYAFAKMDFPGRNVLFAVFVAMLLVPGTVTIVPMFILVKNLGMLDALPGLIIPYIGSSAFGVFFMRQYFLRIPNDLVSAAKVDGAGSFQVFTRVMLPLSRPVLFTFGIMSFVYGWNNFLWPLIATNGNGARVLTVGIATFQSNFGTYWNLMLAGGVLSLAPLVLVFLVFQRYILSSIQLTSFR